MAGTMSTIETDAAAGLGEDTAKKMRQTEESREQARRLADRELTKTKKYQLPFLFDKMLIINAFLSPHYKFWLL